MYRIRARPVNARPILGLVRGEVGLHTRGLAGPAFTSSFWRETCINVRRTVHMASSCATLSKKKRRHYVGLKKNAGATFLSSSWQSGFLWWNLIRGLSRSLPLEGKWNRSQSHTFLITHVYVSSAALICVRHTHNHWRTYLQGKYELGFATPSLSTLDRPSTRPENSRPRNSQSRPSTETYSRGAHFH